MEDTKFKDALAALQERESEQLRGTYEQVKTKPPEVAVREQAAQKESGLPQEVVSNNLEMIEDKISSSNLDFENMRKTSPVLYQMVKNPEYMAVVHDRLEEVRQFEEQVATKAKGRSTLGAAGRMMGDAFSELTGDNFSALGKYVQAASLLSPMRKTEDRKKMFAAGMKVDDYGKRIVEDGKAFWDYVPVSTWENLKDEKTIGNLVGYIVEQSGGSLAHMSMMALSMPAYISARTEGLAGDRMAADGRDEMTSGDYAVGATTAVMVSLLEKTGLDKVFKTKFTGKMSENISSMLKTGGVEALTEFVQEQVEYAGTNVNTEAGWDLSESLDIGLAAAVAGGGTGTVMGGMNAVLEQETGKVRRAHESHMKTLHESEREQGVIDVLDTFAQSELPARSVDVAKQYIDGVSKEYGYDNVYITKEEFERNKEAFEGMNAVVQGDDVAIPLSDYILLSDEVRAQTRATARMAPESFNTEQVRGAGEENLTNLISRAKISVERQAEAKAVWERVSEQLVATGRMTREQAKRSAALHHAWAYTKSEREGIPVREVMEIMGDLDIKASGEPMTADAVLFQAKNLGFQGDDVQAAATHVYNSAKDFGYEGKDLNAAMAWGRAVQSVIDSGMDESQVKEFLTERENAESNEEQKSFLEKFNENLPAFLKDQAGGVPEQTDATKKLDQSPVDQTETTEFKEWAGEGFEIVESDEINEQDFTQDKPYILKAYHGTTHDFNIFEGEERGNKEGHFGAINYFTSDYGDADLNYAGEGADLTTRIEMRAERIVDEIQDIHDSYDNSEEGVAAIKEQYGDDVYSEDTMEMARNIVRKDLHGGEEQVLEVFIKTEKPFVVGDKGTFIEFVDYEALTQDAMEQIAEENNLSVDEIQENIEEYEDQIDERRWEIQSDTESELTSAIYNVSREFDFDASSIFEAMMEFELEGGLSNQIEDSLRKAVSDAYIEDPENGELIGSHVIAQVIKELGFDSIILRDANKQFKNMSMGGNTSHIHVFDQNNTNIKSATGNNGNFDSSDPIIYNQGATEPEPVAQFYSAMHLALKRMLEPTGANGKPNKFYVKAGNKQRILSVLKNLGVKNDEIEWSMLPELIDEMAKHEVNLDKKGRVLVENVMSQVSQNGFRIQMIEAEKGKSLDAEARAREATIAEFVNGDFTQTTAHSKLVLERNRVERALEEERVGGFEEDFEGTKELQELQDEADENAEEPDWNYLSEAIEDDPSAWEGAADYYKELVTDTDEYSELSGTGTGFYFDDQWNDDEVDAFTAKLRELGKIDEDQEKALDEWWSGNEDVDGFFSTVDDMGIEDYWSVVLELMDTKITAWAENEAREAYMEYPATDYTMQFNGVDILIRQDSGDESYGILYMNGEIHEEGHHDLSDMQDMAMEWLRDNDYISSGEIDEDKLAEAKAEWQARKDEWEAEATPEERQAKYDEAMEKVESEFEQKITEAKDLWETERAEYLANKDKLPKGKQLPLPEQTEDMSKNSKWDNYVSQGRPVFRYYEQKIYLPDVDGVYVNRTHTPDDKNVLIFNRITDTEVDRPLKEGEGIPEKKEQDNSELEAAREQAQEEKNAASREWISAKSDAETLFRNTLPASTAEDWALAPDTLSRLNMTAEEAVVYERERMEGADIETLWGVVKNLLDVHEGNFADDSEYRNVMARKVSLEELKKLESAYIEVLALEQEYNQAVTKANRAAEAIDSNNTRDPLADYERKVRDQAVERVAHETKLRELFPDVAWEDMKGFGTFTSKNTPEQNLKIEEKMRKAADKKNAATANATLEQLIGAARGLLSSLDKQYDKMRETGNVGEEFDNLAMRREHVGRELNAVESQSANTQAEVAKAEMYAYRERVKNAKDEGELEKRSMLFIENTQGDWHQVATAKNSNGESRGYRSKEALAQLQAAKGESLKEADELMKELQTTAAEHLALPEIQEVINRDFTPEALGVKKLVDNYLDLITEKGALSPTRNGSKLGSIDPIEWGDLYNKILADNLFKRTDVLTKTEMAVFQEEDAIGRKLTNEEITAIFEKSAAKYLAAQKRNTNDLSLRHFKEAAENQKIEFIDEAFSNEQLEARVEEDLKRVFPSGKVEVGENNKYKIEDSEIFNEINFQVHHALFQLMTGFNTRVDNSTGEEASLNVLKAQFKEKVTHELRGFHLKDFAKQRHDKVVESLTQEPTRESSIEPSDFNPIFGEVAITNVEEKYAKFLTRDSDWKVATLVRSEEGAATRSQWIAQDDSDSFDPHTEHRLEMALLEMDLDGVRNGLTKKVTDLEIKLQRHRDAGGEGALSNALPDAPFKNNDDVKLALKTAIITAVNQDKDMIGWVDSQALVDRWSESYRGIYEKQYDTVMVNQVKQLTGIMPTHMPSTRGFGDSSNGYWMIELTPELKQKIKTEGFPLYQEPKQDSSTPRAQIEFFPHKAVISLSESSDASSFFHESGHLFLEMERKFAERSGATQRQKDDYQGVLKFLGVEKSSDIKVEHHEKFARAFELYLYEGKSPSVEMTGHFRRFKQWLTQVYKNMKALNVELNPEIRDIFDRMLATDEQIERLAAQSQKLAVDVPEPDDGTEAAKEALSTKVIKQLRARLTKKWKQELKEKTAEVAAELEKEKIYTTIAALRETPLNRDEVLEMTGESKISDVERFAGLTSKDGAPIEFIAESLGYGSADSMITEIRNSTPLKELAKDVAEGKMIDEQGDILNDGTIEREAMAAIHNDKQGKQLLKELRALDRKAPEIDRQAVKTAAEAQIGRLQVKHLRPASYRNAEIKAAQAAATALAEGDIETAKEQKFLQVKNFYLWRAANDALINAEKHRKHLAAVQTRDYKTGTVADEYIQNLKVFASAYDLRVDKKAQKRDMLELAHWLKAQIESKTDYIKPQVLDNNLIMLLEALENGTSPELVELKHPSEMSVDELEAAYQMARHLRYVGGLKANKKREARKARNEYLANMLLARPKRAKVTPIEEEMWDKVKAGLKQLGNDHLNLRQQVFELDGNESMGEWFTALYQPIIDGSNKEIELTRKISKALTEALKPFQGRNTKKTITKDNGEEMTLSKTGRLMLALYWGTESSREAILEGHKMTENDVMAMLSSLKKEELQAVNKVWAANESLWSDMSATAVRMDGISPPKVPAAKFEVNGVKMSGGHMRLFYKSEGQDLSREKMENENFIDNRMTMSKSGTMQTRVGSGGRRVSLDINNITRSLEENIHVIAFSMASRNVNGILASKSVAQAIEKTHGIEFLKSMRNNVKGVLKIDRPPSNGVSRAARTIRNNMSLAIIGFSVRNVIQQPSAIFNVIGRLNPVRTMAGLLKFYSNVPRHYKFITESSEFMNKRTAFVNREANEAIGGLTRGGRIKQAAFAMQTAVDGVIAYGAWQAAYDKATSDFMSPSLTPEQLHKKAVTFADEMVAETIGSGLAKDLSPMLQGSGDVANALGGETSKQLTFMGTFFNVQLNLYRNAYQRTNFKSPKEVMNFAWEMSMYSVAPALFSAIATMSFPSDDEEWWEWAAKETASFGLGSVFFLRDLVTQTKGFDPTLPAFSLFRGSVGVVKDSYDLAFEPDTKLDLEFAEKMIRNFQPLVPVAGTGQLVRALDYQNSYNEGKEGKYNPYQQLVEGRDKD